MRVHRTKYAYLTNKELVALVEKFDISNQYGPLMIEVLERVKEAPEPRRTHIELLERQNSLL